MIDLIVAELLKIKSAPFVRGLLFFFLMLPLVLVVLFGIFVGDDNPLRFPQNLGPTGDIAMVVGVLLPPLLLSWALGQEQTNDTWKLVFARHPRRVDVYVAKVVVVAFVVVAFFAVNVCAGVVVQDIVGRVVGQTAGTGGVVAEQATVHMLGGLLMGLVTSSPAMMATVLAQKSGGMAGTITGISLVFVQGILDSGGPRTATFQRPCFYFAAQLLGADTRDTERLDAGFAVLTLALWVLVPVVVTVVAVTTKDVESGNG